MGVDYYVVIPKLKTIVWLGRNIMEHDLEEDEKDLKDVFNLWFDYHDGEAPDLFEVKEKKFNQLTLEDMATLSFYLSKAQKFLMLNNSPHTLIKYLMAKILDSESYVTSDSSEDLEKLKKKGYKIVEED